ncbi:centromere protein N [Biomphalaria pfeifferi]|uniref:Centromere protein N n=1 Tax=Biomphalaria pfeifferi TaxID=112525 RepID=A0AAD8FEI0_BIOPF|nr:centromere protein N [Biomphalaria pfeifferi]
MSSMIEEIIQSIIARCRASTIKETFLRWGRFNSSQLNNQIFSGPKKQIYTKILKLVQESNLNEEIIGDLELVYMQLHSRQKQWKVYKLSGNNLHLNSDPRTLRAKVLRNLQLDWRDGQVFGNMGLFAGGVWLRMHMSSTKGSRRKSYNHNSSVFVVTFPGSPYFILSKAVVKHVQLITKAITTATNAEGLVDIQLSGHHLASLADIVLKGNGQIQSTVYREQEEEENPFVDKGSRKRKAPKEDRGDLNDINDEDSEEKEFRKSKLVKLFGTESQPVLEKLDYKLNVKFHGKPVMDTMCKSSVEVKGQSVLDGIYELAKCGVLKFPLPAHLTTVASSAQRNSFTIQARNK